MPTIRRPMLHPMIRTISLLFLLLLPGLGLAQTYAALEEPDSSGIYKIRLSPALRSAMRGNLHFLRILDSKDKEVPYVRVKPEPARLVRTSLPFVRYKTDSSSSYRVERPSNAEWGSIILKIASNDLVKSYTVSGSDDGEEWFGMTGKLTLAGMRSADGFVKKEIEFPSNPFRFIRIEFDDRKLLPVFVQSIETHEYPKGARELVRLEGVSQSSEEDLQRKKTVIHLSFPEPQVINRIGFDVTAPALYRRQLRLSVPGVVVRRGNRTEGKKEIAAFALSSDGSDEFGIPELFTNKLTIEIANDDNPPLAIAGISLYQDQLSVAADLKKGEQYRLAVDTLYSVPRYDLAYFGGAVKPGAPELKAGEPLIAGKDKSADSDFGWLNRKEFMWACIVFGILVIGYLARNLLRDLDKKP